MFSLPAAFLVQVRMPLVGVNAGFLLVLQLFFSFLISSLSCIPLE